MTKIYLNSIHPSKKWGDVEIVAISDKVTVKFLHTGNLRDFVKSAVCSGTMTDLLEKQRLKALAFESDKEREILEEKFNKIDPWEGRSIVSNRWGLVVVLASNTSKVRVKFQQTNNEYEVFKSAFRRGDVRDLKEWERLKEKASSKKKEESIKKLYEKRSHGVGYIGEGPHKPGKTKEDTIWRGMLRRCYEKGTGSKGYEDCTVCERWHCFQSFCEDIKLLPGYEEWSQDKKGIGGRSLYQLDKDLAFPGNKVYCPDFCQFVTAQENVEGALSKVFTFQKDGEFFTVYNLAHWCRENDKNYVYMSNMLAGKVPHAYGYSKT